MTLKKTTMLICKNVPYLSHAVLWLWWSCYSEANQSCSCRCLFSMWERWNI